MRTKKEIEEKQKKEVNQNQVKWFLELNNFGDRNDIIHRILLHIDGDNINFAQCVLIITCDKYFEKYNYFRDKGVFVDYVDYRDWWILEKK